MKIAFSYDPNLVVDSESKDIIFDLASRAIYARGVKYSTESIAKYRPIYVNGTLALENNDTALNIIAGTNISIIPNLGNITISVPNVDGIYINKLTDYVKASTIAALTTTDSLNIALGKLEHKTDLGVTAYELVAAANNGDTIDNLQEILKVLEGIKDTSTIQQILGNYILKTDTIDWSKIINTPITLAGYGITDGFARVGRNYSETEFDFNTYTDFACKEIRGSEVNYVNSPQFASEFGLLVNLRDYNNYAKIQLYAGTATALKFRASQSSASTISTPWRTILDSSNFSDYALPLSGGGRINLEYGMTSVDIKDWGVNINVATSGGWARSYGIGNESYENSYIQFGAYGTAGSDLRAYISVGEQDYNSATLEVYPTYATILDNTIIHTGNIGDYALSKAGGEIQGSLGVTGNITAQGNITTSKGSFVGNLSGTASYATSAGNADNATKWNNFNYQNIVTDGQNKNQCFKLVTIRIKSAYTDSCISFDISGRSKGVAHIEVHPHNSSTIGSSHIGSLRIIGDSSFADKIRGYVIGNETDSSGNIVAKVIEVWMTKQSQGYDSVVISNVHYGNSESVTVNATEHSSLPTSYESYVDATIGSIYGSITKLTTPRTIWGQSFDGSGDVSGDLTHVGSITRTSISAVDTDAQGNLTFKAPSETYRWTVNKYGSTSILDVCNNGVVLIGAGISAGAPAWSGVGTLQVYGEISATTNSANGLHLFDNSRDEASIHYCGADGNNWYVGKGCGGTGNAFSVYHSNVKMLINSNGNVLIGTTTDSGTKLNVHGSVLVNRYAASGYKAGADIVINKSGDWFGIGASASNVGNISIGTTSDAKGTWKSEIATITDSGNISIGTTNANGYKLYVNGNSYVNGIATASGFKTPTGTNDYVLLAGGGTKALSILGLPPYLKINDIRSTNHLPNASVYPDYSLTAWFNDTGTPTNAWYSGITLKGWSSGYTAWQLAGYSDTGAHYNLYFRPQSTGKDNSWAEWEKLLTNKPTATVYSDTANLGSYWCKVASVTIPCGYVDYNATIVATRTHESNDVAIIHWNCRTNGTATATPTGTLIYTGTCGIGGSFRSYNSGAGNTTTFELWADGGGQWCGWQFTVLSETNRGGSIYRAASWYNTNFSTVQTPTYSNYITASQKTPNPSDYYWANVNISASSSTSTYPTFGSLSVISDSCNNSTDALAYFQHRSNNDWTVKVDSGSYDYGLHIACAHTATNALNVVGASRFSNTLRIGNGTNDLDGNYCEGLRIRAADSTWATIILGATADTGTNAYAWSIHRTSENNFSISRNSSDGGNGLLIDTSGRVGIGTTSPSEKLSVNGWVGTVGNTGWYSVTHAGGIYMSDSTWVRVYNDKKFYVNNSSYDAIHSAGGVYVAGCVHAYANYLKSTCNSCTVTIGSQNSSYCHYDTTAPQHWFNKTVRVQGDVYGGSGYNRRLAYCDEIYNYALPYNGWWTSDSGQNVDDANGMTFVYSNHGSPNGWGILCTFDYQYNSNYKFQLFAEGYSAAGMYYRCKSSDRGGWTGWKTVIDSENIGSQSVNYATYSRYVYCTSGSYLNFQWSGQSGQPTWLFGSNDGANVYVWNPSNFSVNYANSAGNADTVDGEHSSAFAHLGTYNNLTHAGNEFTFASSAFSGVMWINYRTASGNTDGDIIQYNFGNGKGGCLAYISNGYFSGTASYANSSGNADTVDGVHLEWAGSLAASNTSWIAGWTNDGTKLKAVSQSSLSVSYANSAGWASSAGNADTLDGYNSSSFLYNYGASTARPDGRTFTLPGGANAVSMHSGAPSGADLGIFYLSDDNAFVCNSSDVGYLFAAFDTDLTSDFSSASNAAFAVLSNHEGVNIQGLTTINANGRYVILGPQNSSHAHYETNAEVSHWFNKRVDVNGAIWKYATNYGIDDSGYFYAKGMYANRDGSSTNGGLSLYSNSDPMVYGVAFRSIGTYGSHGKVTGDWATYLTMTGATNRGWIFRREGTNVFSVSGAGYGEFNGNVSAATVGYSNPGNAALEVREYARAGTDTSIAPHSMMYAPRIGFHWGNRYWANLVYYDNWFRFTNDDGSGYAGVVSSGFYHSGYASSAYALTSDGGAAHIGSMSVNYAASAGKLNTNNGTSVKPVYFSGGVPVTCSYEIGCVKATKIETVSTTPKYLLGVTADGYLWTYYHTTAYVNSNGVFWSSDRRLKDNIKSPVKNGMLNDETGLIRKFTWKDSGNASYGFIAQELMLHIPEAVDYDETLNKYSVNYDVAHSALIAQLVIKVKELESEISKLKQLIN